MTKSMTTCQGPDDLAGVSPSGYSRLFRLQAGERTFRELALSRFPPCSSHLVDKGVLSGSDGPRARAAEENPEYVAKITGESVASEPVLGTKTSFCH